MTVDETPNTYVVMFPEEPFEGAYTVGVTDDRLVTLYEINAPI